MGNITAKKFQSTKYSTTSFIGTTKREENCQQSGEAYASSDSCSNCSAMVHAASSTPTLAASTDPSTGPCTASSREMLGSRLQKHINTWSATACARARPSSSRRLLTAFFQLGYLPPGRVKNWEHDASLCCHVPIPDRAEAEGHHSSICLAQETPDALRFTNTRCQEILQTLLGDGQLLYLPLDYLHQARGPRSRRERPPELSTPGQGQPHDARGWTNGCSGLQARDGV
jgi:hypothetical protein